MASSMTVKHNTKTWTEGAGPDKEPTVTTLTADEKQKIGAEDLSAVLNRAADKNWVDDRKRVAGHGNAQMDKDAFFKLMLAQLKNQDPMNPLKNHEMAAQLAQFSSLEQMTNMNTTLSKLESKTAQPENFQALNLIGKIVAGDSSKVTRTTFDTSHDFNFQLPQDAESAMVKIINGKGEVLREYKLNDLKAGNNKVTWNGTNEGGVKQPPGEYKFLVEAKNTAGGKIRVSSEFQGQITGMNFTAEGPVLQVGSQSIKMKDISQITDPSVKNNDQNSQNPTSLDLKKDNEAQQNGVKEEVNTSANTAAGKLSGGSNVMTDVAMSRDLMNKLQKELK